MKSNVFLLITTSSLALSNACGDQPPSVNALSASTQASPVNTIVLPKDGNYDGKGKVTKIDKQLGSIELLHEEMPGLMPAMQMEFFVSDKAILEGLAVGDSVNFVLEYKHPAHTVVSVTKIQ
jgi:Cu/Ag efflux protein CusF